MTWWMWLLAWFGTGTLLTAVGIRMSNVLPHEYTFFDMAEWSAALAGPIVLLPIALLHARYRNALVEARRDAENVEYEECLRLIGWTPRELTPMERLEEELWVERGL